ncbi:MAG: DUF5682 family protein [Planctomycetaceae bacterium]|nr:DUF5682 family protein [Planctomycetaceae bacterium]
MNGSTAKQVDVDIDSEFDVSVPDQLASCTQPVLIGVRHHSAALSRAVPQLLADAAPEKILLELPAELEPWIGWLGHADTQAPVALAGCRNDGADLCFYPFADFSPELAAIRWATQHNVPVHAIDLPIAVREPGFARQMGVPRGLLKSLLRRTQTQDSGQLWDQWIEARSITESPERLRRAALLFGWALRWNDSEPGEYDRRREACMREHIAEHADSRCVAIVGSYHASALLPQPVHWTPPPERTVDKNVEIATALIPYAFEQLDERSGYPAGLRDPMWHQRSWEADSPEAIDHALVDLVVGVCRELRAGGHPMNAADAQEVVRVSRDLSRVRRLPSPGRQELVEALQLCLTQGQLYGAGRAVAKAMAAVLIGDRTGELPDDVPRCGLAPHVEQVLADLNLPGAATLGQDKRMRLDPLRSALDRAREVVFQQLLVCQIPYASPGEDGSAGDRESLTTTWTVKWEHGTAAMISLSSVRGATLRQVALGVLRQHFTTDVFEWGRAQLDALYQAAACGLGDIVAMGLDWIVGPFADTAGLGELTNAMSFVDRVTSGHFPGLPSSDDAVKPRYCQPFDVPQGLSSAGLLQAAIARLEGLSGSEEPSDVAAVLDLVLWFQQQDDGLSTVDSGRLLWTLRQLWREGSPTMQGAGAASLLLLSQISVSDFATETGSWLDAATTPDARRQLTLRLQASVFVAQPRIQADLACLEGIDDRLRACADDEFLQRLPALRKGFDVMSVIARRSLLQQIERQQPADPASGRALPADDPERQQVWFRADEAARRQLAALLPDFVLSGDVETPAGDGNRESLRRVADERAQLTMTDRWRLILGQRTDSQCPTARAAARALDELYGSGRGEGSRGDIGGDGGGDQASYPSVREWAEDLEQLFGEHVREEVLGEAIEQGRGAALTVMNEDSLRPSVELLEQVLSLRGGLPGSQTEKLRRIARRITAALSKELATRMAPALTGLTTPRPTRRPAPRLDMRRTIMANLKTARRDDLGQLRLAAEDFFFKAPAKKSMDWHIIYVVDVSGSMEPSVIFSALTAAIFSGLPALSVSFLAFSTEVMDFTGTVDDPLEMLMEVQVGGGTFIWRGVRAAREKVRVPSRTIVLLITDFEEGGPIPQLLSEIRQLTDSGVKALGLAALDDAGKPRYQTGIARQVVACGMPVAALSPSELARWVGEQIR